jgi:hypothetical protein
LDYLRDISIEAGLEVTELSYATVSVKNRKPTSKEKQKKMDRVFVHAVLRRKVASSNEVASNSEQQ